ncbi:MAG: head GIN domain-containing protein [Casimicrobiaceae bacterium]
MTATRLSAQHCSLGALSLATLLALLPFPSGAAGITGSGVAKTETRPASGFHAVVLGVPAKVELRQGATEGLSITGDENIVPLIETVVENGSLKIRWKDKDNTSIDFKNLEIVVNAKNIDVVTVGGSGNVHANELKTGDLRMTIGGSGQIAVDKLEADTVRASIAGSGGLIAAGRASSLDVSMAGSGDLEAGKLESRRVKVTLQGSCRAAVWAKDILQATIAGSGEVTYRGSPQVSQTIAGSGSVRPAVGAS